MDTKFYTIKDISKMTGLSAHTLRFYDKEGLLPFVKRDKNGVRVFTEDDFEALYTISVLKNVGMPIKKIHEFMDLYVQGNSTIPQRRALYEEQRVIVKKQIEELQEVLEFIDYKCWFFEEAEKHHDINYYKAFPEEELPEQIKVFLNKVKEFSEKV
ncbi:MAG: MerR family transcriptional regulator [Erysipelotrichaceae bacterium]|nr:MerR family transcriptional regulator [Erysipelotrichaceae bacterium]